MNRPASRDLLFAGLMFVLSLGMVIQAYSYDDASSHFPRFLALTLLGLTLFYALRLVLVCRKAKAPIKVLPEALLTPWVKLSAGVVLLVCGYAVIVELLGYYLSTLLFLPGSMLVLGRLEGSGKGRRPLAIAVATGIFLGLTWALFSGFLGTRMPEGLFF